MGVTGFHEGELAVQRRAGVSADAARLVTMLDEPDLDGGAHRFLAARTFGVLAARDRHGSLWSTPLTGSPGFLDGNGTTLDVRAVPRPGDPLADLPLGQPVGVLAIEFAIRRRLRVNGTLVSRGDGGLRLSVEQAFGNCPQYIQQRTVEPMTTGSNGHGWAVGTELTPAQAEIVRAADTFFLGTTHPRRGTDSSHRGGAPGFVRVDAGTLWWPDYPGNNMFNSFGNLAVDPSASMLFVDFGTGTTLHLSGTAELEWTAPGSPGDDGGTGRRVRFTPEHIVQPVDALPVHIGDTNPYPRNPRLTS
jgi:predicted pyridoxine 5'-phosphate oxidase superfamily flavin-nucleotide-binding protein